MTIALMPPVVQALGLACVANVDTPPGSLPVTLPIAAAVVTIVLRDDGHRMVTTKLISDARPTEFPLPHLVDRALVPTATVIVSAADRAALLLDAAARRFFDEPHLAALSVGEGMVDPRTMLGAQLDEVALCRRLAIPTNLVLPGDVELAWHRGSAQAAEAAALTAALSRLILWAHHAAFMAAAPDPFFQTMLPLAAMMLDHEPDHPMLGQFLRSRPVSWARSRAGDYRDYRVARDGGDPEARWVTFEDGLFHT